MAPNKGQAKDQRRRKEQAKQGRQGRVSWSHDETSQGSTSNQDKSQGKRRLESNDGPKENGEGEVERESQNMGAACATGQGEARRESQNQGANQPSGQKQARSPFYLPRISDYFGPVDAELVNLTLSEARDGVVRLVLELLLCCMDMAWFYFWEAPISLIKFIYTLYWQHLNTTSKDLDFYGAIVELNATRRTAPRVLDDLLLGLVLCCISILRFYYWTLPIGLLRFIHTVYWQSFIYTSTHFLNSSGAIVVLSARIIYLTVLNRCGGNTARLPQFIYSTALRCHRFLPKQKNDSRLPQSFEDIADLPWIRDGRTKQEYENRAQEES